MRCVLRWTSVLRLGLEGNQPWGQAPPADNAGIDAAMSPNVDENGRTQQFTGRYQPGDLKPLVPFKSTR